MKCITLGRVLGAATKSYGCAVVMFVRFTFEQYCIFSARFPGRNEFFPLSSCNKAIKSHLRQLKVAQTSVVSGKDLILAGVGLFDLEGNDMTGRGRTVRVNRVNSN